MHWTKQTVGLFAVLLLLSTQVSGQEEAEVIDMENNMASAEEHLMDLNESIGQRQWIRLSVNRATAAELESLQLLTPEQIVQFLLFRKTFGHFISLMELQAIPYWDIETVKKLLPYLRIADETPSIKKILQQVKSGEHLLLYRTGGKSKANRETQHAYKQLISYRFRYQDLIQWGVTIEKDSGEKAWADHSSAYLVIRKKGWIKNGIVGDYLVNMGQGLMHWQGHAFGKSSNILQGYRQAELFKPHTGNDENRFHRGLAISLQKKQLEGSFFVSTQKIDANIQEDPISGTKKVRSFLLSGLHRSASELEDKHSLPYSSFGGRLRHETPTGKLGLNFVGHIFALPIEKRPLVYNTHAISGKQWQNLGLDFTRHTGWGFLFGEVAIDKRKKPALVLGLMKSLHPQLDLSVVYRNISSEFKSVASNALTQQTEASNEKGIFTCINFAPHVKHRLEGYADRYFNPWPVYQHDGPRSGSTTSLQYRWLPIKRIEFLLRWTADQRTGNVALDGIQTKALEKTHANRLRLHLSADLGGVFSLRYRTEMVWVNNEREEASSGILGYIELVIKPTLGSFSFSTRYSVFDTDGYGTRIYAYERDVPSYYSIPAHYDVGQKLYTVVQYKTIGGIHVGLKWTGSQRAGGQATAFQVETQKKLYSEWRLQVMWNSRK
jgi:hypothetical protein